MKIGFLLCCQVSFQSVAQLLSWRFRQSQFCSWLEQVFTSAEWRSFYWTLACVHSGCISVLFRCKDALPKSLWNILIFSGRMAYFTEVCKLYLSCCVCDSSLASWLHNGLVFELTKRLFFFQWKVVLMEICQINLENILSFSSIQSLLVKVKILIFPIDYSNICIMRQ